MSSLLARLARHARERPNAEAYSAGVAGSITWRGLAGGIAAVAALVRQRLSPGDIVLLSCPNQLEYPVAFFGILAAGCMPFPISPAAADAELLRAAADSSAAGVIGDDRALRVAGASLRLALPITALPSGGDAAIDRSSAGDLLLQSSGTTGEPKILRRSGVSLNAVAQAMVESIGFLPEDRVLMTVPLTHSYGLEHGLLAPAWAGSCVHLSSLMPISAVLSELSGAGITIFPGVPSTFEMLAATTEGDAAALKLRAAYSAGGPLPRSVFDAFNARYGIRVTQLYGASEIGSVTFNSPRDPFDAASVGRPMRDVSIRVLDVQADPAGKDSNRREGHIAVRAGSMFSGYLNSPAELIDGYFPTGDIGYLDDQGRLFITGRIKLLIDVGGLKVNPLEVESILIQHPAVEACVVVPVWQSQTVFRLKAIVTPRVPSMPVPINELRDLARRHLAAYKIPRIFEVRESLPRSPTGKILRHLVETG
jgi:acyl-CoA synthetase (AMP-forming)/AMP-acid ligase II